MTQFSILSKYHVQLSQHCHKNIANTKSSAQMQRGLTDYYFKYIDRPFCLRADEMYLLDIHTKVSVKMALSSAFYDGAIERSYAIKYTLLINY